MKRSQHRYKDEGFISYFYPFIDERGSLQSANEPPLIIGVIIMGLDMNAGWVNDEAKEDVVEFRWRKHAKLQEFMRQLWYQKQGKEAPEHVLGCEFNCENLYLDEVDIHELKQKLETFTLPEAKDGFFWGHEWQNETARESVAYDLDFCTKALVWLQEGRKVWYSCWW